MSRTPPTNQIDVQPGSSTAEPGVATEQPGAAGSMLPAVLMVAGILLLVIILLSKQRGRGRRVSDDKTPTERLADLREAAASRDSLDAVKVDVEELAHRLAAQLDNKAARLEKLIADADDRLSRLEQRGTPEHATPTLITPTLTNQSDDPTRARVYELADKGHSSVEIARQLDQPTGHVELILSLRSA